MSTLALLPNGSCSIKVACHQDANAVAPQCPQLHKCGSCVMWSPRQASITGRNEGACLLDRDSQRYLDCNAPGCPYYRPRRDSPARQEVSVRKARSPATATPARRPLGRDAPMPSTAALAAKALEGTPHSHLLAELALELQSGVETLPALLERFRGGTAQLKRQDGLSSHVPVERWFLWICWVKAALDGLESGVSQSGLGPEEQDKIIKDIKAMRGSMTTFNVLLRDKEDHFVGQKQA